MVIFGAIKKLIELAQNKIYEHGILNLTFPFTEDCFKHAFYCSEHEIAGPEFSFIYKDEEKRTPFAPWQNLSAAFKTGSISSFSVEVSLDELRHQYEVFYDANELISLRPSAPDKFLIISLEINGGGCTICPQEYNKNEILRYFQVNKIWRLLSSFADSSDQRELIFLYKNKIDITFDYKYEDLSFDFDGLSKFESILSDPVHQEEKKQILHNTLFSFLWRKRKEERLPHLLKDFTIFSSMFHESYLSFSVGFNFDKVRKEYQEKFRDFLSKLNGVLYDTLTRSLAIPVSGVISFAAMGRSEDITSSVVNIAALILSVYTTFTIHFLSRYQRVIVNQCESEFIQIFTALRDELSGLELKGLDEKVTVLKEQCNTINTVLSLVSALSFTNLTLNVVLYFETFIK